MYLDSGGRHQRCRTNGEQLKTRIQHRLSTNRANEYRDYKLNPEKGITDYKLYLTVVGDANGAEGTVSE